MSSYISSSRVSQPNICEISWLGSGENFRSCIPSPDFWFTAAFLVHLWWTDSRSYQNGICFIFLFFTRLGSCITGRFSLVTAWRRTPQAVAPSAALRFAPPVPQLQLAKQHCWGRQQGYQNPDQIKAKSEKNLCRQELMRELKNTSLIFCADIWWYMADLVWISKTLYLLHLRNLGETNFSFRAVQHLQKEFQRLWLRHRAIRLSIKLVMDLSIRHDTSVDPWKSKWWFTNRSDDSLLGRWSMSPNMNS